MFKKDLNFSFINAYIDANTLHNLKNIIKYLNKLYLI